MTTLEITARGYAGEPDLPAIVALRNDYEAIDGLGRGTALDDLRSELADPRLDPARDLRLWQDADGMLIGFAQLWLLESTDELDARLLMWVHPAARGDLETPIVAWAAERLGEAARERRRAARLGIHARDDQAGLGALLHDLGFDVSRSSLTMERALGMPIDAPRLPEGFTLREFAGLHEAEQWVEMFNLSFVDHPNHHPWNVAQLQHYLSEPVYRQDLNLVAVAPGGTLAGFCWALIYPEENARSGRSAGEIDILGTRRGFRSIGLGRALLLEELRRLKRAGMEIATLNVVANNPTGARQLYESVGFRATHTWILYVRAI